MKPFLSAPCEVAVARRATVRRKGLRRLPLQFISPALCVAILLAFTSTRCLAAATLSQQIDPPEANIGDRVTVTLTVQNGAIKQKASSTIFGMLLPNPDISLPPVDGLQAALSRTQSISINGNSNTTVVFTLIPTRAGDFTIPAFDVPLQEGAALRTQPMKLHVLNGGNAPASPSLTPPPDQPPANPPSLPAFNPNGPVVMPPNNSVAPDTNSSDTSTSEYKVPMESDGRPAKVFVVISPKTTDAYVGESIPLRIDWYIRLDVDTQQDSLPTIKGSDFLMNNLSINPHESEVEVADERYRLESWITAISAPKSGDIPLQMERDTYWVKTMTANNADPFGAMFSRPDLAHKSIPSNPLTIHVHELPQEGRPASFTGAIGHFTVTGSAQPLAVAVGDPVTLHFTVTGEGNFDYVKCPNLADDTAWKSYVPASKIDYQDESHTQATKMFEQAVIPQKNGSVPLPQATFSYFDPTTKQYVTVPIALPTTTVTGSDVIVASASADSAADAATTAASGPKAPDFAPNRLEVGSLQASLTPVYHRPWFWAVQALLVAVLLLGALYSFWRSRANPDPDRAERALRQRSLTQEEDAMSEAVRRGDARAFFIAARHAVQLQLGAQWRMKPEALTLGEIGQRDPHLAETLRPLFTQADEVIYSGQASADLNLAQWELHVRQDLLQPQPARP